MGASTRIGRLDLDRPVAFEASWRKSTRCSGRRKRCGKCCWPAAATWKAKVTARTRELADQIALLESIGGQYSQPDLLQGAGQSFLGCNHAYEAAFATRRQSLVGRRVLDLKSLCG